MRRYAIVLITILLLLFLNATSIAGEFVTLRLVEASNTDGGVPPELKDVGGILRAQLPFTNYRLVDRGKCNLPANQTIRMSRGYNIQCTGTQDNFTVNVRQRKSEILQTTVAIKDGKPLMLGGFPSDKGKLLLILLVH